MNLSFDEERELLTRKKTELLEGVAVIDDALAALDRGAGSNSTKPKEVAAVRAGRRPMSDAAREAARQRMKKYWRNKRREARGK